MAVLARQVGIILVTLLATSALLAFTPVAWGQSPEEVIDEDSAGAPYAAGELIVTYEDDVSNTEADVAVQEKGAEVEEDLSGLDATLVEVPEVKAERSEEAREESLQQVKEALEGDPAVESVYYNYVRTGFYTPSDRLFGRQYGLRKAGFEGAWNRTRGRGARVAVVDSGAALRHMDLRRQVVAKYDFRNDNATVEDLHGHGTHVAGTVAARTGNVRGVAGGCPGCGLIIAKAIGRDLAGYDSDIARAITWSANNRAKAINLSLGGPGEKSVLKEAIDYATRRGAVVVAAAGNGGTSGPIYPAAYPNVVAVAATGPRDGRDSSYTTGDWIDVSAPGLDIISTTPGGYEYKSGTSMAAPHVSALVGLLASQGHRANVIRLRLARTAVDLGPRGRDPYYGAGRINASRATRR